MRMPKLRLVAVVAVLIVATSGCYELQAKVARDNGKPVPWFCHPTAFNSVTGPGMGSVNFYAGVTRKALTHDQCVAMGAQLDAAKAYAQQYPTNASAERAGFRSTFPYISGMGTHHGLDAFSPALLADPDFDPQDPIIPGSPIDDVFDPTRPEYLQYSGDGDDAVLVGMSYYVRTTTGKPPAGFPGNNDWWHHHPSLCFDPDTAQAYGVNTSDEGCASSGGINVHLQDYYMLHVWLVDDLEYRADVHAPMHPCITGGSAIFDMGHPCHGSRARAASARSGGDPATDAAGPPALFCGIGKLAEGDDG